MSTNMSIEILNKIIDPKYTLNQLKDHTYSIWHQSVHVGCKTNPAYLGCVHYETNHAVLSTPNYRKHYSMLIDNYPIEDYMQKIIPQPNTHRHTLIYSDPDYQTKINKLLNQSLINYCDSTMGLY